MQPDPLGIADQINLYAYAHNDPFGLSDPSGLASREIGSIGFSLVQGAVADVVVPTLQDLKPAGEELTALSTVPGLVAADAHLPFGDAAAAWVFAGVAGKRLSVAASTAKEASNRFRQGAVTRSSIKRIKRLINNLSQNDRVQEGLSQEKLDQLRRVVEKAGAKIRNDGTSGVKGFSAGKPHVQTDGLGGSIDTRHIRTQKGVR